MKTQLLDTLVLAFCRLGIAGLSKWAPGTCGTFLALLVAPWLFQPLGFRARCCLLLGIFFVGALAATKAERLLGCKDPSCVVIDELAGSWMAILPFAGGSWLVLAAAFVIFRIFDIAKPWPIHASEDWLPDGFGVMIDDVLGGAMTMVVLLLLRALGLFSVPLII